MKLKNDLTINIRIETSMSLWTAIKFRIAGIKKDIEKIVNEQYAVKKKKTIEVV